MKTVQLVINAGSGSVRRAGDLEGRLRRVGECCGVDMTIRKVAPKELDAALSSAGDSRPDLLMVAGGDGTIRSAAEVGVREGIVIGVLPLGTMNLLPKDLGIPLDPEAAARALLEGQEARIDVATANGQLFLHSSLLGSVARFGIYREKLRRRRALVRRGFDLWRSARFLVTARRTAFRVGTDRYAVGGGVPTGVGIDDDAAGRAERIEAHALAVSVNRLALSFPEPYARRELDGGRLCVYAPTMRGRRAFARVLIEMGVGTWTDAPAVEHGCDGTLLIDTGKPSALVSNDGEPRRLRCPIEYRLCAGALRVAVPRDRKPNAGRSDGREDEQAGRGDGA
ncbi:MAG: diacylglycerol/lipid kinase family protein [Phycisphaerales bacterium]